MKGLGVCEWSLPYRGEELFDWMSKHGVDNISVGFDYDACQTEESQKAWCGKYQELAKKYGIDFSILALNTLCDYGMNQKEHEETVKDILGKGIKTAALLGAPAVHLPSFGQGEIKSAEELPQVIKMLQYACRLGEQYQIQIGYESPLDVKDLQYVTENVHGETFYMLFDNENVSLRGIDPVALYEAFPDHYIHSHLKAGMAEEDSRPLATITEFGGLKPLAEAMKKHGFDGWIILETDYWKGPKDWEAVFEEDKKFILESWK